VELNGRDATASPLAVNGFREDPWTRGLAVASQLRPLLLVVGAIAVPVAVSLAIVPFRSNVPAATVALGLAIVVSLVAAVGTRVTAVIAAFSAALCFDILFTEPYGSFSISNAADVETAVLLLVGGLIVGQLSARNRSHKGLAVQGSIDLGRVQGIATGRALPAARCVHRMPGGIRDDHVGESGPVGGQGRRCACSRRCAQPRRAGQRGVA